MKYLILICFIATYSFKLKAQSSISITETVSYVNKILEGNEKSQYSIYKFTTDRFGNLKFYSKLGEYWFNINDAVDMTPLNLFVFPPTYSVKSNIKGEENNMGYIGSKNNFREKSFWPGNMLCMSRIELADMIRLVNAFKHLKSITKDPFKN